MSATIDWELTHSPPSTVNESEAAVQVLQGHPHCFSLIAV